MPGNDGGPGFSGYRRALQPAPLSYPIGSRAMLLRSLNAFLEVLCRWKGGKGLTTFGEKVKFLLYLKSYFTTI